MKFIQIILLLLLTQNLFAEKVEITSTKMVANEEKKQVHFVGDAKVHKGKDWLHAERVIVFFNENNDTERYEARGNVTFEFQKEDQHYKGSADMVKYHIIQSLYVLIGNAVIDDLINKSHVDGDKIKLDMTTGNVQVEGDKKKPVKFIFEMEDKE